MLDPLEKIIYMQIPSKKPNFLLKLRQIIRKFGDSFEIMVVYRVIWFLWSKVSTCWKYKTHKNFLDW